MHLNRVSYDMRRGIERRIADSVDFPALLDLREQLLYVLRVFPPCALVPRVQGSSGSVATVQFVWRGHAKTPTTRAGPWPDCALRLE